MEKNPLLVNDDPAEFGRSEPVEMPLEAMTPEASDGVTLVIKSKRGENTPRRSISPGAP